MVSNSKISELAHVSRTALKVADMNEAVRICVPFKSAFK